MTLPCCNPNLGKKVSHIFADFYPERLGSAVIVNHKSIFYSIWKAIRKFLDPVTAKKVVFLKNPKKHSSSSSSSKKERNLSEGLREFCDEETAQWLETEIRLNQNITETQMRFWEKPSSSVHDPRGTDTFIREFVECKPAPNNFMPHPNITDLLSGKLPSGYPVHLRSGDNKIDAKQLKEYGIESGDMDAEEDDD